MTLSSIFLGDRHPEANQGAIFPEKLLVPLQFHALSLSLLAAIPLLNEAMNDLNCLNLDLCVKKIVVYHVYCVILAANLTDLWTNLSLSLLSLLVSKVRTR